VKKLVLVASVLMLTACGNNTKVVKKEKPKKTTVLEEPIIQPTKNVTDYNSPILLVDPTHKLPDNFIPQNLVQVSVPFIDTTQERKMMRKEAADALAQMFNDARNQGVPLLGVSGYRSYKSQKDLFDHYVSIDGYEKASTYSAIPGTSEHETGLAIDVTSIDGKCAAEPCFGGTKQAQWLQAHVADYGYIIRYPEGKDKITGYEYEPWHIRYVGNPAAKEIMNNGITLEEYYMGMEG
jgi:D-alanyl-D-alanine carboxypeptidase